MNDMLSWLLAGHVVGDYLFQNRWMATKKTMLLSALVSHSAVYACAIWISSLPDGGLSPFSVLFVFATHVVIDKRDFTRWWCRHVTQSDGTLWLVMMADQSFHIVILALTCFMERAYKGGF